MDEREITLTTLTEWGPTLVILLAVLGAGLIGLRTAGTRKRTAYHPFVAGGQNTNALRSALSFAESINAYDVSSLSNPYIHLGDVVRLAPIKYQDGAVEIPRHFKDGHVVSVDLGLMSVTQAARLVDFCSGMLAGTSGWLFRATDMVIVLTTTNP
ncbi:MAG TPA: cell division protein SepF [Streptosporangiaceae bacterium]|nr:cell division protein SepF [Streptosporangiaceae bacterium]